MKPAVVSHFPKRRITMKKLSLVYSADVQKSMENQSWNTGLNIALRFGCNVQTKLIFRSEHAWKDTDKYSATLTLCRDRFCSCFRITLAYSMTEAASISAQPDARLEIKGYDKDSHVPKSALVIIFDGESGAIR
jgi:hypothetical protein